MKTLTKTAMMAPIAASLTLAVMLAVKRAGVGAGPTQQRPGRRVSRTRLAQKPHIDEENAAADGSPRGRRSGCGCRYCSRCRWWFCDR